MKTRRFAAVLLALGIFSVQTAAAGILVIGQDRRAASSAFVNDSGDFDSDQITEVAPDLDPFDVSLLTDVAIADASAAATADQRSTITAASIAADGFVLGEARAVGEAIAYASAQSNVAIRFTIDATSPYTLQGHVEGEANSTASVAISRPFETVAWFSATDERVDVSQQGTLEAGTYDLNITCGGSASASALEGDTMGSAGYDVLFLLSQSTDAPVPALAGAALRAYPNPFRASTRLTVPDGIREVRVLDARGRLVRTLPAGPSLVFDGRDTTGRPLASGVYWIKAVGGGDVDAVKVVRLQ